jgi:ferredoxin
VARAVFVLLLGSSVLLHTGLARGESRFPRPEFESGYVSPETTVPPARSVSYEYLDTAVLLLALSLSSYLALGRRSRRGIFLVTLFSLAYFGFWRKGCICAVGALQNVVVAVFDGGYAVPLTVVAFFALPLVFTLFFGRTFCASVCPLGAAQDVVVLRPVRVSPGLEHALGMLPYVYLGAVVLFAANGAGFMICRFDPFVSFFRLGGSAAMIFTGVGFLAAGVFLARPYCRFLCPYGVLLKWMSGFSRRHVTITPDACVQCRLCEGSCPFGAIRKPTPEAPAESRATGRRRLAILLALLPVLVAGGGWLGASMKIPLSQAHPTVRLAEQVLAEEAGRATGTTPRSEAFRQTPRMLSALYADASRTRDRFGIGGLVLGCFLGLAFGGKLLRLSVRRERRDYEPDRATCLSCGRCFRYCPLEQIRVHGKEANYARVVATLEARSRWRKSHPPFPPVGLLETIQEQLEPEGATEATGARPGVER